MNWVFMLLSLMHSVFSLIRHRRSLAYAGMISLFCVGMVTAQMPAENRLGIDVLKVPSSLAGPGTR
ncbi:MAG: hypothetical protein WBA12_08430, partial [Catalinimonas sp.]